MTKDRILVTRSSMPPLQEYINEIAPLWESHWLTNMGEKHRELEVLLKKYLDCQNVVLFTNGHNALECTLEALELKGKVITTPFTFASTTHAIVRKGLTPVFADVKPDDLTINPDSIEKLIDSSTCAIVPVHVYGNLCDTEAIQAIADRYNLKVVYDAAHAFGVERDGVSAATFGDASMFSFHATKVFNTIEGGAVCFGDSSLKPVLDQWKNFGITSQEDVDSVGGNAKMNEFCAAMGICNLRHIDEEISKRAKLAELYRNLLSDITGLRLLPEQLGVKSNYAYMPIVIEDSFSATRDEVFNYLSEHGVVSRKYFYPLTSDYACYRGKFDLRETPVAQNAASHVLALPIYADLGLEQVRTICEILCEAGGQK